MNPARPGEVVVTAGRDGLRQEVHVGRHRWVADEPASVPGGTDAGPDPYGLLLSALGACKGMTVRMYAERKGWPLEAVRIRLSHGRTHAKDCADCETREGRVDEIRVAIAFDGDLDDAQRTRLLEIADRCPVHRTLTGEIKIRTALDSGGTAAP